MTLPQGDWEIDPEHSEVAFRVRHLGLSSVKGRFASFAGAFRAGASPAGAPQLRVEGSVETASIETGDRQRDEFLRSAEFFDCEHHPRLAFSSSAPPRPDGRRVVVEGELTIGAATHPLKLLTSWEGPDQQGRLRLWARGQLRRSDYGLRFPTVGGYGDVLVGETVSIEIDATAVRPRYAS